MPSADPTGLHGQGHKVVNTDVNLEVRLERMAHRDS